MRNRPRLLAAKLLTGSIAILLVLAPPLHAVEADNPSAPADRAMEQRAMEQKAREIFVPFEDLHVLLQQQPRRVLLSRTEYEELRQKAERSPESRAPRPAVLLSADYTGSIRDQRAQLTGTLVVDVLEDGLHAVPLDLSGVGLRGATLDGKGAAIGRGPDGALDLFIEGRGRHQLLLDMVAPLQTTAARQVLHFHLPRPPAAQLRLTVPGDVEIKSGADVASRIVDAAAAVTRFELLLKPGDTTLLMSLNSRLQRQQRTVVARSVLVDEVTEAYEKLHATVSLEILHRAVDRFQFVVPEGFEIIDINSPMLARWNVEEQDGRRLLNVRLREQTTETVLLNFSAIKTAGQLKQWSFPRLQPLEVVGQATVVGLLLQQRLNAESIAAEKLIPIDTAVLGQALPESIFNAEPGTPPLRPVVAYYAPESEFSLRADFDKPAAEMAVRTSLLLTLSDKGHEVLGGLAMLPAAEKRFSFDLSVPPDWHVTSVTAADEKPLMFQRYDPADPAEPIRVRVSVPEGMPVGREYSVNFHANHTPPGWLADWQQQAVAFPVFTVVGASEDVGAIAVEARDDMTVRPRQEPQQLMPLDEAEKERYGLAEVVTNLAYRYESPQYQATLLVERTQPRLTARTFSFLRVKPGALVARYEVNFNVEEARTRRLSLLLPAESTPESLLTIIGLGDVKLKQYDGETIEGGMRRWDVQLAEARRGTVRLAVDFEQPLSVGSEARELPIIAASDVVYQSGVVAVEGSAELNVKVTDHPRQVDVGELVDAEYQPGRRLLGAYGFVGDPAGVIVDVSRDPSYTLPAAIAERAELSTRLSADGASQTQGRFSLRTKALYLEIELPPESELWSVLFDGAAVKPQLRDKSLLVSLPVETMDGSAANALRELRIVYATQLAAPTLGGKLTVPAPRLLLRDRADAQPAEVPLADLVWRLHLPTGYEVVRSGGTVVVEQKKGPGGRVVVAEQIKPELAAITLTKALYDAAGGIDLFGGGVLGVVGCSAREAARMGKSMRYSDYTTDDAQYYEYAEGESDSSQPTSGAEPEVSAVDLPASREVDDEDYVPEEKPLDPKVIEGPETGEGQVAGGDGGRPGDSSAAEMVPPPSPSPQPLVPAGEPPTDEPPTDEPPTEAPPQGPQRADLTGVRSLEIDLHEGPQATGNVVTFRSLGVEPRLEISLGSRHRNNALTWGMALALALGGLAITGCRARIKVRYVLIAAAVATGLALAVDNPETIFTSNVLFYTAVSLVPYYLVAAAAMRLVHWCRRVLGFLGITMAGVAQGTASHGTAAIILGVAVTSVAMAAPPEKNASAPYVIQVVEPSEPVELPDDAVILPYDAESNTGIADADKLLLPYAKYVELWNRAYPDKKIETPNTPARYALAGAAYRTLLTGDEYLLVTGELELEVYADGYVEIPLGLRGGVLARAELDGKPARLKAAGVADGKNAPNAPPSNAKQAKQRSRPSPNQTGAQAVPPDRSLVVLYVSGKGRHRLQLAVRLRLERQGGSRVAKAVLPSAVATALTLTVPQPQTELRLGEVTDRAAYETQRADEEIETALGADGTVSIQWCPKVAEGRVDRSLTAQSNAVLDVQEDGLRLVWELQLKFPRSEREQFDVEVPADYLVEKVAGTNVRGWEVREAEGRTTVEITLLKAAKQQESVALHMWRRGTVGQGEITRFDVPVVTVPNAALHNGEVTIRRSPLLDLRTLQRTGVTRTDPGPKAAELAGGADSEESPLGIRPYQAYRFIATPFSIGLSAARLAEKATAEVRTVLKIAEYERSLETRAILQVQERPIHCVEMLLPGDFTLKEVSAPGEFQWALTESKQAGRQLLSVYLGSGRQGEVPVLLRGTLGKPGPIKELPLPQIEICNLQRQQGDIAVQVDPGSRVETAGLQNCERVDLLRQRYGWLNPGQRTLTRLGVRYRRPDYSGTLKLSPKTPVVTCSTISNVRITDRAVEETILLDFSIRDAGIRQLSFRLPEGMKGCRINAPMLRQKTIETAQRGGLRVKLQLQDEVMDQLRVLVENDRMLKTDRDYTAPVPTVETGRTDRQFVTLESAGQDEVVVDEPRQMKKLVRQQKEWDTLENALGGGITQAYVVTSGAVDPNLVFRTKDRRMVETAGARIGLAETSLVLDANGAYRASVTFRLDNTTEQFLEIELPKGAELWTARVAGEAVKPTRDPKAADPRLARIPLVKTAPGDLDYEVVLKYGGKMSPPGRFGTVDFPLVHTKNIDVETSQVRLFVPKTHRWFDFGGTMRLVAEDAELAAGYVSYQTKQAKRLIQTYQTSGDFAKVRALNNLKQLGMGLSSYQEAMTKFSPNEAWQTEWAANAEVLAEAEQLEGLQPSDDRPDSPDNRDRLNTLFEDQKTTRSHNVVQELGGNWAGTIEQGAASADGKKVYFNGRWLDKNQLDNPAVTEKNGKDSVDKALTSGKPGGWQYGYSLGTESAPAAQTQPGAPKFAQGQRRAEVIARQSVDAIKVRSKADTSRDALARYNRRLQEQAGQQQGLDQAAPRVVNGSIINSGFAVGDSSLEGTAVMTDGAAETSSDHFDVVVLDEMAQRTLPAGAQQVTVRTVAGNAAVAGITGLASLEVALPQQDDFYQTLNFTTPRGEVKITARSASRDSLAKLADLGILALIVAVVAYLVRLARDGRLAWLAQPGGSTLLICLGVLGLFCGVFPVAAVIVLSVGIAIKVYRLFTRRRSTSQPAAAA